MQKSKINNRAHCGLQPMICGTDHDIAKNLFLLLEAQLGKTQKITCCDENIHAVFQISSPHQLCVSIPLMFFPQLMLLCMY